MSMYRAKCDISTMANRFREESEQARTRVASRFAQISRELKSLTKSKRNGERLSTLQTPPSHEIRLGGPLRKLPPVEDSTVKRGQKKETHKERKEKTKTCGRSSTSPYQSDGASVKSSGVRPTRSPQKPGVSKEQRNGSGALVNRYTQTRHHVLDQTRFSFAKLPPIEANPNAGNLAPLERKPKCNSNKLRPLCHQLSHLETSYGDHRDLRADADCREHREDASLSSTAMRLDIVGREIPRKTIGKSRKDKMNEERSAPGVQHGSDLSEDNRQQPCRHFFAPSQKQAARDKKRLRTLYGPPPTPRLRQVNDFLCVNPSPEDDAVRKVQVETELSGKQVLLPILFSPHPDNMRRSVMWNKYERFVDKAVEDGFLKIPDVITHDGHTTNTTKPASPRDKTKPDDASKKAGKHEVNILVLDIKSSKSAKNIEKRNSLRAKRIIPPITTRLDSRRSQIKNPTDNAHLEFSDSLIICGGELDAHAVLGKPVNQHLAERAKDKENHSTRENKCQSHGNNAKLPQIRGSRNDLRRSEHHDLDKNSNQFPDKNRITSQGESVDATKNHTRVKQMSLDFLGLTSPSVSRTNKERPRVWR